MRLFASLVLILVTVLPSVCVAAGAAGTDIIFLVDQSGSMMGRGAAKYVANDPLGKRISAIRSLDQHLLASAVAGYVNRVSVIEFGGRNARSPQYRALVTLKRKEIPAVPPGQSPTSAWEDIKSLLSPLAVVMRGDTDIAKALALAEEESAYYRDNPPVLGPGAKAGNRERIVVLITDGAPYAAGVDAKQIASEIEAWSRRISSDSTFAKFLVFGFNDQSRYWENQWGAYWMKSATRDPKSSEGLAFKIDKDDNAVKEITSVLSELIPPGVVAGSEDTYTAPAYLKQLSFSIDFFQPHLPEADIKVFGPPDGKGTRLPVSDIGELSAAIRLDHPAPGLYRLRSGNAPYRVSVLPVFERARLSSPVGSVKQYGSDTVRYSLEGSGPGGKFAPQANLPEIRFELQVEDPNGTVTAYAMAPASSIGDVETQRPLSFDVPGDYHITFSGRTQAINGSEHEVYKSEDLIRVDDATPVQAYFVEPAGEDPLTLWEGKVDVPVEVRFRHGHTGAALGAADVLEPGEQLSIGWFPVGSDGEGLAPPVPMAQAGDGLRATLPVDFGRTRWDLLGTTAGVRLQLEPTTPSPWRGGLLYTGVVSTGDFWLGPELQVQEDPLVLWVWVVGLLLGVVALALLWHFFVVRWLIQRSDNKYKRAPRLSFMVPRNPDSGSKQWPLQGQRIVTEPRFVTLADGDSWTIDKFCIKRIRKPGNKVAVEVRYRPKGSSKAVVKARLEATNDSGSHRARHHVSGLADNQAADFVLFLGRSDQR